MTVEDTAVKVVAKTVGSAPRQVPMALALLRLAGNALARITNHEAAAEAHLAQFHHHHKLSRKVQL